MLNKTLFKLFFAFCILINSCVPVCAKQNISQAQQISCIESDSKLFIKNLSSTVFDLLKSNKPENEIKKSLKEILVNNFNVQSIAKFTLGHYKRGISSENLNRYVDYFVDTLVNMYFDKFSLYKDALLTVESTIVKNENKQSAYIVTSIIKKASESDKKIEWLLYKDKNGKDFKIYDVIIDGISVSKIQQDTTINAIFEADGLDNFIKKNCNTN